jgi:hypothetical protein
MPRRHALDPIRLADLTPEAGKAERALRVASATLSASQTDSGATIPESMMSLKEGHDLTADQEGSGPAR